MSTATDAARANFESLLSDTCTITTNPDGTPNGTFNQTTGVYDGEGADDEVSDTLPCIFRSSQMPYQVLNEQSYVLNRFDVLLRAGDPVPEIGAIITCVSCPNNPALVGEMFEVIGNKTTSLNFAQNIQTQQLEAVPRRA